METNSERGHSPYPSLIASSGFNISLETVYKSGLAQGIWMPGVRIPIKVLIFLLESDIVILMC